MSHTVIAFDPSSTATGYAVAEVEGTRVEIGEWGVLKPYRTKDSAIERVSHMGNAAWRLLMKHDPGVVVIEEPGAHVHGRIKHHAPAGLAVYGFAVGYLYRCAEITGAEMWTAKPNEWTCGKSKKVNAKNIALKHPTYDITKDKGLDAADAIGLIEWWAVERVTREAVASHDE